MLKIKKKNTGHNEVESLENAILKIVKENICLYYKLKKLYSFNYIVSNILKRFII